MATGTGGGAADERTSTIRALWGEGAYEEVGALFAPVSDHVVGQLDLAGRRVLDAATGTGNTALAAARAGADVDAFDLTPRLLEIARARAGAEGLGVRFVEGDLVDIPYPDASFDVVLSTFGAFTVDDPAACARELVRVTRPGGEVCSTAWTDQGAFAALTSVVFDRHPGLRPAGHLPSDWSRADWVAALLADHEVTVAVDHHTVWLPFPSVDAAWSFLERTSGPVRRLRAGVEEDDGAGAWDAVRHDVLDRWRAQARADVDGVALPATYGLARITRGPA